MRRGHQLKGMEHQLIDIKILEPIGHQLIYQNNEWGIS
jgi:hypothetical protein